MNVNFNHIFKTAAAVLLATSANVGAQTSGVYPSILSGFGTMHIRASCYETCREDLDEDLHYCNKTYPPLPPPAPHEWNVCAGEALAIYYQCTEDCPPFEAPDFLEPLNLQ